MRKSLSAAELDLFFAELSQNFETKNDENKTQLTKWAVKMIVQDFFT